MKCLTFVTFILLFISTNLAAETLSSRMRDAASSSEHAEQVITSLQTQTENSLSTEDYLVLAESYQTLGKREAALDAVNKAENMAPSDYLRAMSLFHKAQIYGIYFQDAEMALVQLVEAEKHLISLKDVAAKVLLSDVLNSFASANNVLGNLSKGLEYAKRSLLLAEELSNTPRQLNALVLIGRLALQNNQYKVAFSHFERALVIARELSDDEQIASIYFRMGMAYRKLDQHDLALTHFQQAAERYQQLNRLSNYSHVLIYMAESYMEGEQQIAQAETLLQQALEIAEQLQHKQRTALVYYSLGRAALLSKNYPQSEQYYQLAFENFKQLNMRSMMQETALAIVKLFITQQRYAEAKVLLNELSPDIEQAAIFLQLRYHDSAAALASAAGDWQLAYTLQEKVTQLNQQELAEQMQYNMAELSEGLSEINEAEQYRQQLTALKQTLAETESRQFLLQALLVLLIFICFVFWQLVRRQQNAVTPSVVPELAPPQWVQFREKAKVLDQQQTQSLLVIMPRQRAALQRQFGRRIVTNMLKQLAQELDTEAVNASFSGSEMLWLAVDSQDKAAQSALLEQAIQSFSNKLLALGVAPAILTAELELASLLGPNWHKRDLNGLTDIVWFGWSLLEQSPPTDLAWRLSFTTEHARPCEWQVEDLRTDIVNAYRLGELNILVNQQVLTPDQVD
ncbi:tetratricopeptide repeat protein [Alishewanella sp. 16-MA]|uniref:Tetratricopeptide repeat protein n=1 Tax=Alishewanella maricola TaxID=2795740 RepID=A0ABS8C7I7_9ALTE|nr:tetratricopeptide repeat protein [Alishewanella maricola]MCB5228308.1 tetratricopeptide repeat protein [Alishewanella maricola]